MKFLGNFIRNPEVYNLLDPRLNVYYLSCSTAQALNQCHNDEMHLILISSMKNKSDESFLNLQCSSNPSAKMTLISS